MTSGLGRGLRETIDKIHREGIMIPVQAASPLEAEREWYQRCKEAYYFHDSYNNPENHPEGFCNPNRCIPRCRFYPATARIRDDMIYYDDGTIKEVGWN
jgi:hypothetical protein